MNKPPPKSDGPRNPWTLNQPLSSTLLYLTAAVLGIAWCLAALLFNFSDDVYLQEAANWPATEGTFLTSRVLSGDESYHVAVRYEYRVDGKAYIGTRRKVGDYPFSTRAAAQAVQDRYVPGQTYPVYYDPQRPEISLLERDRPRRYYGVYLTLLPILSVAAVLFALAHRAEVRNGTQTFEVEAD